jgi:GDPmannose 4,6-dehydratase
LTTWIVGAGGQDGKILTTELGAAGEKLILHFSQRIEFPNGLYLASNRIDAHQAQDIINQYKVERIYFLAAHSRPSSIRNRESRNSEKNFLEVESLFEVICNAAFGARWPIDFFFASSCLIYSGSNQSPQDEETIPVPTESYALSKVRMSEILYTYSTKSEFIRPVVGILYNHESTFRTKEYLSHKVINHALDIYEGKNGNSQLNLFTGNDVIDLSHAADFVSNLIRLMKSNFMGSCIFSSGSSISIQDFCEGVFKELNLDYRKHILFTDSKVLSQPRAVLVGNNALLKSILHQPKIPSHSETITRLVKEWQEKRVADEKR